MLLAFVFAALLFTACGIGERAGDPNPPPAAVSAGGESVSRAWEDAVPNAAESTGSESPAVSELTEDGFTDMYRDWCDTTVTILAARCGGHSLYEYGVSGLEEETRADAVSTVFRQRAEQVEREHGLIAEMKLAEGIGEAAHAIRRQHLTGLDEYQLVADGLFFLL